MRVAALLAVVVAAWAAGAARATTFHVENEHGVPLYAWATVSEIGLTTSTNEAGEVEPASEPGDTVTITRSDVTGPCGAPEGPVGPSYTVPDPEPDFVAIVLPALAMPSTDPALSPEERGLVGRLNEQRAMAGAGAMIASEALDEAADRYGGVLHGDPSATDDHCRLAGPEVRAVDRGWPSDDVQELLAGERSATAALETWLRDPTARATLLDPGYGALGIARVGDLWVALVARPCGRLLGARCRMTGDVGDASLIAAPSPRPRRSRRHACSAIRGCAWRSCSARRSGWSCASASIRPPVASSSRRCTAARRAAACSRAAAAPARSSCAAACAGPDAGGSWCASTAPTAGATPR
jgi:uncharacterized protein YkwD